MEMAKSIAIKGQMMI